VYKCVLYCCHYCYLVVVIFKQFNEISDSVNYAIFSSICSQYQGQKFAYLGHKIVKCYYFKLLNVLLIEVKLI